jgi:ABC-type bacteriocin/lantibiotic exporter with double-glycine peptidase domain
MVEMIKKYTIEEFKSYGKAGSIAQEALSSIRTVLSLGVQKDIAKTYSSNLKLSETMAKKKGILSGLFSGFSSGIFNVIFGVGIYYGVYLTQSDCLNYSVGNIMQAFFSNITGAYALSQALPFIRELAEAKGVAKKIYDIIDTKSEIDVFSDKGGIKLEKLKGSVDFESIYFHYPSRPEAKILKGLNLKIPAGLTVALVGSRYE